MTLSRCLNGPAIYSVRADADQSPTAAGAEGDYLIKGIQQEFPFFRLNQVFDLRYVIFECVAG